MKNNVLYGDFSQRRGNTRLLPGTVVAFPVNKQAKANLRKRDCVQEWLQAGYSLQEISVMLLINNLEGGDNAGR